MESRSPSSTPRGRTCWQSGRRPTKWRFSTLSGTSITSIRSTCRIPLGLAWKLGPRWQDLPRPRNALGRFVDEFLAPSIARRRALLEQGSLPGRLDVLTALLANEDRIGLSEDVLVREIGFYLQAGAQRDGTLASTGSWSGSSKRSVDRSGTYRFAAAPASTR